MRILVWLSVVGLAGLAGCIVQQHRYDNDEDKYVSSVKEATSVPVLKTSKIVGGAAIQGMPAEPPTVPGGPVVYDSEPVHRVYVTGFEITSDCISDATYAKCVANGKCQDKPFGGHVDAAHAAALCKWLGMRLPTEAELEVAVRGRDGATVLPAINEFGLNACGTEDMGQWVADGYLCDAYVGRSWANPQAQSPVAMYRHFATGLKPNLLLAPRMPDVQSYGFRCARTTDPSAPPQQPPKGNCTGNCQVLGLAMGERFGCALRSNGSVWCWGSNAAGQLGTGDVVDAMPASTARAVVGVEGATAVAAGQAFACALTSQGQVVCWGDNRAGQIGGSALDKENKPFTVATGALGLAVAGNHGCALRQDQSVACWGRGALEPDGQGPTQVKDTGITGASVVAAGPHSACALVGDQVRCWGSLYNAAGNLELIAPAAALSYDITATALALGDGHSCAVVNKTVRCWGDRSHWGGTGIAQLPETIATTVGTTRVYATATGTLAFDQGSAVVNVNTDFPTDMTSDGVALSLATFAGGGGCMTLAGGVTCFGIERGQLGRSNGCNTAPAKSNLELP